MVPRYEAIATMMPAMDESTSAAGASGALSTLGLFTGAGATNERKDTALALLEARSTFDQFIAEDHLMPVLFPDNWDAKAGRWKPGAKPPTLEDGYLRLKSATSVENDQVNNVIRFHVTWPNAVIAARWANGLVAQVNRQMQRDAIARSDRMIAALYQEFDKTQNQALHTNIADLIEQQIRTSMLARSRDDYALQVIDPALPSSVKTSLSRLIVLIGGIFIGLLIGVPLAFFFHSLDVRRARDRAMAQR
jgi:capsular polysaccharide biosynthesis protein